MKRPNLAIVTIWVNGLVSIGVFGFVVFVAARAGDPYPALAALLIVFGLAYLGLRERRRCPACGKRSLPRPHSRGIRECDACGERFQRVRRGSVLWLEPVRGKTQPGGQPQRLRRGDWERIPRPDDHRWAWIGPFLPRLRNLRRQLRPTPAQPRRILNLTKPAPAAIDATAPWESFETPCRPTDAPATPSTHESALAQAVIAVVMSASILALIRNLWRLEVLDSAYCVIVLFAVGACAFTALTISRMLRLSWNATLGLLTADLLLKALHLAAIGRLPDMYVLGTMAFVFPTTPLLLGLVFRRWKAAEEPAGEFTTGRLLRNKLERTLARGRRSEAARRAG